MRTIKALCGITAFLATSSIAIAADPVLRLEVPGPVTSSSSSLTNPTWDGVSYSSSQLQSLLGTNFFGAEANSIFAGLATLRQNMSIEIRDAFLANPKIKAINSVIVDTKPINATLANGGTGIGLTVNGLKANVDGKADGPLPILCSSVNFNMDLLFNGTGSFNASLVEVGDLVFTMQANVRSASCSGVFGFLGDLFGQIMNGESTRSFLETKMRQQLAQLSGFQSIPTMFSLSALNANILNRLPAGSVKDKVVNVVGRFLSSGASRSGLALTLSLHDNFSGTGGHLIKLRGSQIASSGHMEFVGNGNHFIEINPAPGASTVQLYEKTSFSTSIFQTLNVLAGETFAVFSGAGGTQVWAATNSSIISGLRSSPKLIGTVKSSTGTDCQFTEGCSEVP